MPDNSTASRYELREPLGSGGMGQVYRALDTVLQREVAVKMLRPDMAQGLNGQERLLREARMAATLSHPNICVVHDVGQIDGLPFVTMELLSGETLRRRLSRQPGLRVEEAFRIGRDIAAALAEAHRCRIIHRDIKPENVMLLPDGRVKVLDFGLAKPMQTIGAGPAEAPAVTTAAATLPPGHPLTQPIADGELTSPGQIIGTYQYLSPEQVEARPADSRSDIFSLGVLLYETLTGRPPFAGHSIAVLLSAIRSEEPMPLERLCPGAPKGLARIVERCLRKNPDERFPHGMALAREMEQALAREGARPRPIVLAVAGAAAIVAMAAAITAGWMVWQGSGGGRNDAVVTPVPHVRQLTFTGDALFPYYSPDGSKIAFRSGWQTVQRPMFMPAAGGDPRPIPFPPGEFFLMGWDDAGESVLGMIVTEEKTLEIWEAPIEAGEPRLVRKNAQHPSMHPSGEWLAYCHLHPPYVVGGSSDIRLLDLATGATRLLYGPEDQNQYCFLPQWSPDGSLVAFACADKTGAGNGLFCVDREGLARLEFVQGGAVPFGYYDWTADGGAVVTGATEGFTTNLWELPLAGRGRTPRRLTTGPDQDWNASMEPRGRNLVFQRMREERDLVMVDLDRGGSPRLAGFNWRGVGTTFTADGDALLASEIRDGVGAIVEVGLADGHVRQLASPENESCTTPLALNTESISFVCQPREHALIGGKYLAGQWVRTVYEADRSGQERRVLFRLPGMIVQHAVSPSGRRILFGYMTDETNWKLMVFDRHTGEVSAPIVSVETERDAAAAWSQEEGSVLTVHERPGAPGQEPQMVLERIELASGDSELIATLPANVLDMAFSRDGSTLLYGVGPRWSDEIYVMPTTPGSTARLIYRSEGLHHPLHPAVSPDGRIAVVPRQRYTNDLFLLEGF